MSRTSALLLALLALPGSLPAVAQSDYRNRPITMIVPFPGGGGADAVPRLTQDAMSEALGQPVVIETRPGAGGTLGATAVMRSASARRRRS